MARKTNKSEKIRAAIRAGESVKDVAKRLKVKPAYVYSVRWHMKKGKTVRTLSAKASKALTEALNAVDAAKDPISPEHYDVGGIQTHEYIEAKGMSYNVGTAVAYLSRAHHKGAYLEDIKKAVKHLEFEISRIENPRPVV